MNSKKIWFALVGVEPLEGNELTPKAKGAYVNVAAQSDSEENFKMRIRETFLLHKFKIKEIEDIQTEDTLNTKNPEDAEKNDLLEEINEGYEFAWVFFILFSNYNLEHFFS